MKIYHTATQEDFYALMVELEGKGITLGFEIPPTAPEVWGTYKQDTCISVYDKFISHGSVGDYKDKYPDVPIIEYKAKQENINDKQDNINPNHYTFGGIETIEYLKAKMTADEFRGFLKGNVLKYVSREAEKNGVEDLKKAKWYLDKLLEVGE